jgi:alpha/beta superfamily hydrolase
MKTLRNKLLFSPFFFFFCWGFLQFGFCFSQETYNEELVLETQTGKLYGTLLVPTNCKNCGIALLIAGSGATDRNGNSMAQGIQPNSIRLIAETLAAKGIASLRYDKRGIGQSKEAIKTEKDMNFEISIADAVAWLHKLKEDKRFKKMAIIGHSEGSLIGMLAAQQVAIQGFVSISGVAKAADEIILEQIKAQPNIPPLMVEQVKHSLDSLKQGQNITVATPILLSLFRPSVQPYLISWFKYSPISEIKKLNIPILIIQGTTDIQVKVEEAQALAKANLKAELTIIEGMNHVLKDAPIERSANIASYMQANLPLSKEFVIKISDFMAKNLL